MNSAEARTHGAGELQRVKEALAAAEAKHAEQAAEIEQLHAEAVTHEEEMTVLMAHLNEARRPVQIGAGRYQASERGARAQDLEHRSAHRGEPQPSRDARAHPRRPRGARAPDPTPGAQREQQCQRPRAAANEHRAAGHARRRRRCAAGGANSSPSWSRLDGDQHTAYPLARRTRIGRAPGCEMQIDSQSVSRNHAMLLKGARELIVEDLNSTNGVLVNGRKVSRQVLSDGDVLTIGETQFRCVLKFNSRSRCGAPSNRRCGRRRQVRRIRLAVRGGRHAAFRRRWRPRRRPTACRQADSG